jgi:hypothetical protein
MEIPLADVPGQEPTPAAPFPVRQCLDGIADSDSAGDRQFSFLEFRCDECSLLKRSGLAVVCFHFFLKISFNQTG